MSNLPRQFLHLKFKEWKPTPLHERTLTNKQRWRIYKRDMTKLIKARKEEGKDDELRNVVAPR